MVMERLLVIGGTGLLGSKILEVAQGRFEVFGTYNLHASERKNMWKLDVCNRERVFELISRIMPDFVIDTHGLVNIDHCEKNPAEAWMVNVDGAKNVAEACKEASCKYMFMSTDNVFDGKKGEYTEEDEPHALNYYAKTKLIMEKVLSALDVDYVVARSSVMYGTGGSGKASFPAWLIEKLRGGERVRIVTDQENNPTFTDNLAEFLLRLYERDERGVFHITGTDCISRYDFSVIIADVFGLEKELIVPVTSSELNQVGLRPGRVNMVNKKVENATGIRAFGIEEGLSIFKKQLIG